MVVMEKAGNMDLRNFLSRIMNTKTYLKEKKIATVLTIMRGLLSILDEIHSHGIICADLKPENTMVTLDPNDEQIVTGVKLIDFGLFHQEGKQRFQGTREYLPFQSDSYAAVAKKWEKVEPAINSKNTDLFAVGVMFLELFGVDWRMWSALRKQNLQLSGEKDQQIVSNMRSHNTLTDPVKDWSDYVQQHYGENFLEALRLLLLIDPDSDSRLVIKNVRKELNLLTVKPHSDSRLVTKMVRKMLGLYEVIQVQ